MLAFNQPVNISYRPTLLKASEKQYTGTNPSYTIIDLDIKGRLPLDILLEQQKFRMTNFNYKLLHFKVFHALAVQTDTVA